MPISPQILSELVKPFWADVAPYNLQQLPLMAHYTSMDALEKIMHSDELWFSHPLIMNDHEEVHHAINTGQTAIVQNPTLRNALGSEARHSIFVAALRNEIESFAQNHLFDTYVFCLSEHDPGDNDGRLSMWRAYGGNGTGAAIVFDPKKTERAERSPFIFDKVAYKAPVERMQWIHNFVGMIDDALHVQFFSDQELLVLAKMVFERLKIAALFSKHKGFDEEKEWRIVFMPGRAPKEWEKFYSYVNGPRGLEPKLKFIVKHIDGLEAPDLSLTKVVDRIILGPSRSSPLVFGSAQRMLLNANKGGLIPRLRISSIPYRHRV